ncbi:SOS response-associated peptidase family protein [Litorimonas haliclonae]|uniref:SOS response-associated peptidase family protein n=1 Tax=Litorimonas haliclonae TaxID=2081977 RepID=UPI0039F0526A
MCNLYSHKTSTGELVSLFSQTSSGLTQESRGLNIEGGYVGADQDGLVIVNSDEGGGQLDIVTKRWGFPAIKDGAKPITNIRNLDSRWWQNVNGKYLHEPEYRCLVPFERFAEWNKEMKENAWFSIKAPQAFFAGIWRPWRGERLTEIEGKKRRERRVQDWQLYAFLTTEPNDVVAPIHPKAMPVILTESEELEEWLGGGAESLKLQRPLPSSLTSLH